MPMQFGNTSIACTGRGCTFSTHQTNVHGAALIQDTTMSWADLLIRFAIMAVIVGIVAFVARLIAKRFTR